MSIIFEKGYLPAMIDPAFIQRILINLEFLSIKDDDTILDCGCGIGVYTDIISEKCNCRIIGVDITVSKLFAAMEKTLNSGGNAEFVLCDARYLPFKDQVFNKVLCTEVLEHISDDVGTLRGIRRVTKTNGTLALSVPNANYPFFWDPLNKILEKIKCRPIKYGFWSGVWAWHCRLYEKATLISKMRQAGFNIQKIRHIGRIGIPFNSQLLCVIISLTGVFLGSRKPEKVSPAQTYSLSVSYPKKHYTFQVFFTSLMELICNINQKFVFQNCSLSIAVCARAESKGNLCAQTS